MSIDPRTADANRARAEAQNAKIDAAIADDVAVGMSEKADHERAKANIYATQAARKAEVAAVEQHNKVAAQQESRQTKFTLWLVLGIIAIGALAALAWSLSRPAPTDAPVVSGPTRTIVASPTAGPGVLITNPNNGVPVVPTPVPAQVAPPAQTTVVPSVIVVPVPVPVENSPAVPATPRGASTPVADPIPANPAPAAGTSSGGTLEGYVEPKKP